jgi:hypothetical protein
MGNTGRPEKAGEFDLIIGLPYGSHRPFTNTAFRHRPYYGRLEDQFEIFFTPNAERFDRAV